jgi:hypothetical protein
MIVDLAGPYIKGARDKSGIMCRVVFGKVVSMSRCAVSFFFANDDSLPVFVDLHVQDDVHNNAHALNTPYLPIQFMFNHCNSC